MLESILNILEPYQLTLNKTLVVTYTVSSVVQLTATTTKVIFTGNITGVSIGMFVNIDSGNESGFHEISAIGSNYVVYSGDTADTTQNFGSAKIYRINNNYFNNLINSQLAYVRKITGLSFNGVETIVEYHDGNGLAELVLDRKPIVSLTSVELLTIPLEIASLPENAVEVIANMGILRIKRLNVDTYTTITPLFPYGQNNIKITYTAGYALVDMPIEVLTAISLLVSANILGSEASYSGGGVSLSVVSYSKSYGAHGKFSEVRTDMYRQAKSLLGKYMSGVVGN